MAVMSLTIVFKLPLQSAINGTISIYRTPSREDTLATEIKRSNMSPPDKVRNAKYKRATNLRQRAIFRSR